MTRGIQNVSGVSCHIACALQLLAHSVPPLTHLFQEPRTATPLLRELGRVLCDLVISSEVPVDATLLYLILQKHSSLDPEDVGDASTAVYQLWQVLQALGEDW